MEERSSNHYASPSNFPNANNISFFAHQAIRAGYTGQELRQREFYRNPNPNIDFRGSIQRELEKEKIRAEIIAEEVFRRKLLEDEVRREMMMEREMAMRRGGGGERELGFGSTMWLEHKGMGVPLLTNFEHGVGVLPHHDIGFGESRTLPFQRDPVVAANVDASGSGLSLGVKLKEIKEVKGSALEVMNKDKFVFVAKPDATDLKRKATTPPLVAPVEPSAGLKKPKSKDEWSCALCRITATSERALNDHLQGKKHKSRESGLNSQRTGFGTAPLPKLGGHSVATPIKVPGATNSPSLSLKDGIGAGELFLGKLDKPASQGLPATDQKCTLMKETDTSVVKGKIGEASVPEKPTSAKPKKKFKYFCEACQVGAYSLKVFNAHKKGKRHLAKALVPNKTDEISALESTVEEKKINKEPKIASSLEKGVVKKETKMDIGVDHIHSYLEKNVVEETKMDTSVDNKSLEKVVIEENKGMDTIVAKETNIESEDDKVENSKESDDCDVRVEEDKDKVLEIDDDFVSTDKE